MEDMTDKVSMQDTELDMEIDPTSSKQKWLEEFMSFLSKGSADELKKEYRPEPAVEEAVEVVDEASAPVEGEEVAPSDELSLEGLDEEALKALLGGE